ncbi:hypothetical protein ACOMHN_026964 [Nucella lapillus]
MDELQALTYFSSLNNISRKLVQPEILLVKHLGNTWSEYSHEQQEKLFDDLSVPHSSRFENSVADDVFGLQSCWPTLKLPSGEKIIVDENDIWTWRDEHSGPFSWKSKSQQDLTLLDLEGDNLTKSHGKTQRPSESEEPASPTSPIPRPKFFPNHDSWTRAVLEDFSANCQEVIESPVYAIAAAFPAAESPSEEVNPAFEGSVEDLSPSASPEHDGTPQPPENRSRSETGTPDPETLSETQQPALIKKDADMTPPPKKLSHPVLGKKEGKMLGGGKLAIDSSQQLLIVHNREEEGSAFTNPAMEVEWSNFVGQSSTDPDDADSLHSSDTATDKATPEHTSLPPENQVVAPSAVNEPPPMVMDRGGGGGGVRAGEDSVESTPDHTTQLLKPVPEAVVRKEAEKEEVVYVVDEGSGDFSVSSKLVAAPEENADDSDILRSGFDFLDNW